MTIARVLITTAVAGIVAVTGSAAQAVAPASTTHSVTSVASHSVSKPVRFKNCFELNRVWKHGVGVHGAKDRVAKGKKPVKNFRRDNINYFRNMRLDRDKDKIACEKH